MITLYTVPATNVQKVLIALEELELPYERVRVDVGAGDQLKDWFRAISPSSTMPAMIDHDADDFGLFESGAILQYLAEKAGRLLPTSRAERFTTLAWLSWQISGLGPALLQLGHFPTTEKDLHQQATEYFTETILRFLAVLEARLSKYEFVAYDEYTIADIAIFPQVLAARTRLNDALRQAVVGSPNIVRWLDTIGGRPAVERGMAAL